MKDKLTSLRLTLTIQETMIKLWTLRAKVTRQKITEIKRAAKS